MVIGPTGRNFAAGMSGGIAYVYDDNSMFEKLCNREMVDLEGRTSPRMWPRSETAATENHLKYTGSLIARGILDDFEKEIR